jgi:hypothetical protein
MLQLQSREERVTTAPAHLTPFVFLLLGLVSMSIGTLLGLSF